VPRTVVAILDRDSWRSNADVMVIADSERRRLTWVPRDLWSRRLDNRLSTAVAVGGGETLLACLAELGLPCTGAICIRRRAVETALATVDITVPVRRRMAFWYPLKPTLPIEEGRRQITFEPPSERLTGERIHQWLGARKQLDGSASDIPRLFRQQVLLKALLRRGFDFGAVLGDSDLVSLTGVDSLAPLRAIEADWRMKVFGACRPARIHGKAVLVRTSAIEGAASRLRRGLGERLAGPRRALRLVALRRPAPDDAIAWGRHVPAAFRGRVRQMAERLGVDPSDLMALMAFETGRSFSPAIRNRLSGATGLIQFLPTTAAALGTSVEELATLSPLEQLEFVERYLAPHAGRMPDLASLYMAVLCPNAVTAPLSYVLFAAPSETYARNRGLDTDDDGHITKGEAAARIADMRDEGMRPENIG